MDFYFTETHKNQIIEKQGSEFYSKVLNHISIFSERWGLSCLECALISSLGNLIFFCKSELHGNCVLKLYAEMLEYNALCEYSNSNKFCRLYEFDKETRAMLIERIIPGTMLKDEPSLDKRLYVFSELFNELHIEPKNPDKAVFYQKLLSDVTEVVKICENAKELYTHALKANKMLKKISSVYDKNVLLHWDLKNDNILLDKNGKYKIIDPFGFIGVPVLDVVRFITKECSDTIPNNRLEIVERIIDFFEKRLNIPKIVSKQCFYIDTVFLNCHFAERGWKVKMDDVRFAETILSDG